MHPIMKMYILLREDLPDKLAPTVAAHASLAMYLKFKDHPNVAKWLAGPFRKVVCRVTAQEFLKAKEFQDFVTLTESAVGDQEVALGFCPREDGQWEKPFKFYKLWAPVSAPMIPPLACI